MEKTINVLEVAAELAHNRTFYESGDLCNNEDDMFDNPTDGIQVYNEKIQDRFNEWYDYYLGEIEKYAIN